MQTVGFQQAIESIQQSDPRYAPEAYFFLRDALEATLKQIKKEEGRSGGHVSAGQLLEGIRLLALKEFGPMAISVFEYWGITGCEDFGNMVFNLVDRGVFGKTDEDTIQGFRNGYDFEEAFARPFRPRLKTLSSSAPPAVQSPK